MMNIKATTLMLASAMLLWMPAHSDAAALDAERDVLDSGMVVIHQSREKLPVVNITLLIRAGSADDPAGKAGLASMTAAMLDEGTKSRTSEEISEEIEFVGGSLSASSDIDYTTVSLVVLKKDIETGFSLMADMLLNPAFRQKDFERQRGLYLGRIRQEEEDPSTLAWRAFAKALFPGHPYGHEVHGSTESISALRRADIAGFHKAYYTPDNAILVAVGEISKTELDALISKHLGGWRGRRDTVRNMPPLPEPATRLALTERDVTQASIVMGHAGVKRSDPDYYAIQVMNYILGGGGFSSRLMDRVREDLGLAYGISSGFVPYLDSGFFYVEVQTKNSAARQVIAEVKAAMELMRDKGVTEAELSDAKAYLTGSLPRRMDTSGKMAGLLATAEFYGLGLDYPKHYLEAVGSVSLADIQRVAKERLDPDGLVIAATARLAEAGLGNAASAK